MTSNLSCSPSVPFPTHFIYFKLKTFLLLAEGGRWWWGIFLVVGNPHIRRIPIGLYLFIHRCHQSPVIEIRPSPYLLLFPCTLVILIFVIVLSLYKYHITVHFDYFICTHLYLYFQTSHSCDSTNLLT